MIFIGVVSFDAELISSTIKGLTMPQYNKGQKYEEKIREILT